MKVTAQNQKWTTDTVKTECNAEGAGAGILLPVCQIGEDWYAYTSPDERGQWVGQNVCLTGGAKPYGKPDEDCVEVEYYWETFNAGCGRVTAGKSGYFQIPKGKIEVSKVTSFYRS